MFETLLIANRGEIACRIIRTARRLGIRTIAVYSEADADAQHVRLADAAYPIGGPRPQDSYLRAERIIEVARASGAQAVHPGYGFLSENADFADACEQAGIVFIGPMAASMRKMGSKAGAKELMSAAGVPVVPGYTGADQDPSLLQREADRIGYPLMIKAAHGGGGKGMRIVHSSAEFSENLQSCQREAASAFGRDRVLLERYIETPRHIEFQIFGDCEGRIIHLGERECSAQRRYQKVIEESPSPFLSPAQREAMGEAAVKAGQAIDYRNAGTVEFIVGADGGFYFMEINTRLQVEHPVTELVTGLDLVEWQLRVAAGETLPLSQQEVTSQGHAIEVRLYAEDPEQGFLPGSGRLERLRLPTPAEGVRLDGGVVEGDTVTIYYDPMIAKLIVHGADRREALARLEQALADCEIVGPKSNIAFLERLVRHRMVREGLIDTGYLDRHLDEVLSPLPPPGPRELALAACVVLLAQETDAVMAATRSSEPGSPWALADGWRLGHAGERLLVLEGEGQRSEVHASGSAGSYRLRGEGFSSEIEGARCEGDWISLRFDGEGLRLRARVEGDRVLLHDGIRRLVLRQMPPFRFEGEAGADLGNRLLAPMPGRVVLLQAEVGLAVEEGQALMVMEAMKMELTLRAPRAGTVAEIRAAVGEFVEADAVLLLMEESP